MQRISSLIAAAVCTLALGASAYAAGGIGRALSPSDKSLSWLEFRAAMQDTRAADPLARPAANSTEVVALDVEPTLVQLPETMSGAVGIFESAVNSFRAAVANDAAAVSKLKARGYEVEDVLAATREEDGTMTVFVGSPA